MGRRKSMRYNEWKAVLTQALFDEPAGLCTRELAEKAGVVYNTLINARHKSAHPVKRLLAKGEILLDTSPGSKNFLWKLPQSEEVVPTQQQWTDESSPEPTRKDLESQILVAVEMLASKILEEERNKFKTVMDRCKNEIVRLESDRDFYKKAFETQASEPEKKGFLDRLR